MDEKRSFGLKSVLRFGLLAGGILLYLALVGMIASFVKRDVIYQTISLSFTLILISNFAFGYLASKKGKRKNWGFAIADGAIVGIVSMAMLSALVLISEPLNLRNMFVNASPNLVKAVTFGNENIVQGLMPLVLAGIASSILGSITYVLPPLWRKVLLAGLITVITVGTLSELVGDVITNIFALFGGKKTAKSMLKFFLGRKGLSVSGSIYTFIAAAVISYLWLLRGKNVGEKFHQLPLRSQKGIRIGTIIFLFIIAIFLPEILGGYLSEILVTVAIFTVMGFGLNIVVGFAGLLDLGYVAFFAIGAYTMGVLTSTTLPQTTKLAGFGWSFWQALPFAVGVAVLWGIVLGIPVLRMRGDYLAIVTLGFGEIIRVLALSNFLQPKIGGAQGILGIAKPYVFGFELKSSQELYYLVVLAAVLAAFVSWRLRDSRAGRSWMAMREDEDVAEAMGINLIKTKLLAFAAGGAFSGLAGAIFAAKLTSIYPHSFNLLISINVLSLIIVGGVGSLPGVVIGALALVGLPELLREFSEFRMLIFGALLVTMMLVKPEGFWPATTQKRELHAAEEAEPRPSPEAA